MSEPTLPRAPVESLSLVGGGPLDALLVRIGMGSRDQRAILLRAAILAAIAWLPALLLALVEGVAFDTGSDRQPFLTDIVTHARLIVALPMLVVAELVVEQRTSIVADHFIQSGIIRRRDYPAYQAIVQRLRKLRNAWWGEILLLAAVVLSVIFLRLDREQAVSTWQWIGDAAAPRHSLAGLWILLIGIPLYQFLLYRWIWRYLLWCGYLWRVSRLDLRLFPTHPDGCGGLGFLSIAQTKFFLVGFAFSATISASIGQQLLRGEARFGDFEALLVSYAVATMAVLLGPLFIFSRPLFRVKMKGLLEYGTLAHEYVWLFHRKWIKREIPEQETIIGSADIQSLADLGNSFKAIQSMRLAPIDLWTTVLPLISAIIAPFLPWVLVLVPLDEILSTLLAYA